MSTVNEKPGSVGIVSRSASLTSEIVAQTSAAGLGQSITIGIGGDPVHGIGFVDCLKLLMADADTQSIILIGEIGGTEEEEAAEYLQASKSAKPVLALIAGRHAPVRRRMGHAGTLSLFGSGGAQSKIRALKSAGVHIAQNASILGETMRRIASASK
jgi:succinyl-CoA synthetase alpha subunit